MNIRHPISRTSRAAFTLVEILIVVVILGILAAIVVPQFSNASLQARENTLRDELRYLRTQITVFKAQHWDAPPGYPAGNITAEPTVEAFLQHMLSHTNERCGVSVAANPAFPYGPYLSRMPANPLNGLDTVKIVGNGAAMPVTDDSTGWIYKPQTQQIIANTAGNDIEGTPYADY